MMRFILIMGLLIAVGAASAWVVDHPGEVIINWQGWRIETTFAVVAMGAAALTFVVVCLMSVIGWIRRMLINRQLTRHKRGMEGLNRAVVALASGDAKEASRLLGRATRLLPPQPLTHVLAAQVALLRGKPDLAEKEYKALLKHPEAEFIGLRGLLTTAMHDENDSAARAFLKRALTLEPKSPWALKTSLAMDVKDGEWSKVSSTLEKITKLDAMAPLELARLEGVVRLLQAREADLSNNANGALRYLDQALDKRKNFIPALVMMARLMGAQKNADKARKLLVKVWSVRPHPDLAKAYLDLSPMDTPTEKLRLVQKLVKDNPTHLESNIVLAQAELAANHGTQARKYAKLALHDEVSPRVYHLLAEAEREAGDKESLIRAEEALMRAKHAGLGAGWTCKSCSTRAKTWVPYCGHCHEFDALEWVEKPQGAARQAAQKHTPLSLLPDLIMGQPPRPDA